MNNIFYEWLHSAQNAWFAPRCPLCDTAIGINDGLCAGCSAELPTLEAQCQYCALPLSTKAANRVCPECARRPCFDHALAAFPYRDPIAWLVGGLKYRGRRAYARVLGDLLAEHISAAKMATPDILAPVPLHPAAFRRRGFNQAERIAARLEEHLDWPLNPELFRRVRDTKRQSTLDAEARTANVRNAFVTTRDLNGLHIAIVDDVVTTTRTAATLARCARRAGASRVDVYCVARA